MTYSQKVFDFLVRLAGSWPKKSDNCRNFHYRNNPIFSLYRLPIVTRGCTDAVFVITIGTAMLLQPTVVLHFVHRVIDAFMFALKKHVSR